MSLTESSNRKNVSIRLYMGVDRDNSIYISQWRVEKNGFKSPKEIHQDWLENRLAA